MCHSSLVGELGKHGFVGMVFYVELGCQQMNFLHLLLKTLLYAEVEQVYS
jgi:hypothetical protein